MLVTIAIIGLQVQEAAVALVGLGDQVVAAAEPRVARRRASSWPPMTKVGSRPPSASTLASSDVVVVLPCVPATAIAAAEAHQLAEHLRARHDRDAPRARFDQFRVVASDRAGHDDARRRRATFAAAWPRCTLRAERREPARRRVVGVVRARHLVAERAQHLGDAAHADAADADEVHARRCAVAQVRATSACRRRVASRRRVSCGLLRARSAR